ncbi:hypothetical protein IWW55_004108, partial [Coemansia sp. RSA 2706]
ICKSVSEAIDKKVTGVLVQMEQLASRSNNQEFGADSASLLEGLKHTTGSIQRQVEQLVSDASKRAPESPPHSRVAHAMPLLDFQADLQPSAISAPAVVHLNASCNNRSAAGGQCIAFSHAIPEQRTVCDTEFYITSAMQRANAGWARNPPAPAKKRTRTSKYKP